MHFANKGSLGYTPDAVGNDGIVGCPVEYNSPS